MSILLNKTKQFLLLIVLSLVVFSCSKDAEEDIKVEQNQKVSQTELKTILEADNLSSIADSVVTDLFNAGISGKSSKNDDCYEAEYTDTGFTVTFPNCNIEDNTEKLNGTLTVVYGEGGESYAFTVTFNNLMVGDMSINGTRSFGISAGEQENSVELDISSNMSITMADSSIISEEGNKTMAIVFGEEFGDGMLTIDGKWTIKAEGNTYSVDVTQLLSTDFGCDYIGKGLMLLNKNGLEVSVDFGDGGCDNIASVIYPDGTKEDLTLEK